jgi:hypothetical protein
VTSLGHYYDIIVTSLSHHYDIIFHIFQSCSSWDRKFLRNLNLNEIIITPTPFDQFSTINVNKFLNWYDLNMYITSPIFDGLFLVIKSLIILIASFVRGYIMMLKLHEWSQEIWSKNVHFNFIIQFQNMFLFLKSIHIAY